MKRWTSLLLCAALAAGLAAPAMAEPEDPIAMEPDIAIVDAAGTPDNGTETTDARLARVTGLVKGTLDLDTEQYTDFRGNVMEQELGIVWDLYWTGENGASLNVEALEDGTIVGYWYGDSMEYYNYSRNLPTFPKVDTGKAKEAAETFLNRVLDPATESVELEAQDEHILGRTNCGFYGNILLNGLPSPLSYSVSVRGSDNTVISFHRDAPAMSFLGNIPSKDPAVSQSAAADTLKGTLNLELIYVTSEEEPGRAVLRYVPKNQETRYVDAQTGELVDAQPIAYYSSRAGGLMDYAEAEESADNGAAMKSLTQVELEGVEKLDSVLDKTELDRHIRAESAYQLDGYTLASANYRLVKEDREEEEQSETVLCTINYTAPDTGDNDADMYGRSVRSRTFTVNARTGEVRSLYSSSRWDKDRKASVSEDRAQTIAASFLSRFTPNAARMPLYDSANRVDDGEQFYSFTFTRQVNGYFFPANFCTIQIDCETGAVAGISYTYDRDISFDAPKDLIDADAALTAWLNTYDVALAYRLLPKDLTENAGDGSMEAKLVEHGMTQFYTLFLSYGLERERWCPGIDAKTGDPVQPETDNGTIEYSDVSGHAAESEIVLLASYGIGYTGGAFRPDKSVTQWDAVCLLASTQGYRFQPETATDDDRNAAYGAAYRMGALTREERSDNAILNRSALVKLLLDSAGYGPVAELNGIFAVSYSDKDDIPVSEMGYAALAQGLNLAAGEYAGTRTATRAEAAAMLCRLMERGA